MTTVIKKGGVTYDPQVAHNIGRAQAEEDNAKYAAEKARQKAFDAYRGYREPPPRPQQTVVVAGSAPKREGFFDRVGRASANFMFGGGESGGGGRRRSSSRRSSGGGGGFGYDPDAAVGGFLSDIGEGGWFGSGRRRRSRPLKRKVKTKVRYVYVYRKRRR